MSQENIFSLARAAGLARGWVNAKGQPMQVAPEDLRAILEALDLPCATEAQCHDSHQRLAALDDSTHLPPLVTGTVGIGVQLPSVHALAGKPYRIVFEDGGEVAGRFADALTSAALLPAIDRPGYHRLLTDQQQITLAIAPPRCFGIHDALGAQAGGLGPGPDPQLWGLGVQLYGLRRPGDGGIGDFTALSRLAAAAAAHGAAALAISPVHAMFSADVTRFSPYGPSSRLFLNALHIDAASVLGPEALAAALAALGGDLQQDMAHLEQLALIDWPAAARLKLSVLRGLHAQFLQQDRQQDLHQDFERFQREHGDALRDHARFEALHAWHLANGKNGDWRHWSPALRDPLGLDVENFARSHAAEVSFHEFLQWQAARGLAAAQKSACAAGMPIGLIADLAVGADNGGSQAWSRQAEIINGLSVGAPPDAMNPHGQSWGLGAFSPHAMKAKGFGAYIEMLRATFAYAGGARIDHVLGLSRLWLVPHGAAPMHGAYLQYPLQDLLRLIALESWRHRAIVIGEDLGTVPAGFDETLAQAGLLGIRVLLFQQHGEHFLPPAQWWKDAIATTATHDLPTIAGWWQGRDIDWRAQLGLLESGQTEDDARDSRARERAALWQALSQAGCAHGDMPAARAETAPLDAAAAFMSATRTPLSILPIEDALGLVEQPNLPGTIDTHPNWRRRLPQPVDTLLDDARVRSRLAIMNKTRAYRGKS